jgi:hypothetical protein
MPMPMPTPIQYRSSLVRRRRAVEGVVLQDGAEGEPDGKYGKERDDLGWSASA